MMINSRDIIVEGASQLIAELKLDQSVTTRQIVEIHLAETSSAVLRNALYEQKKVIEQCTTTITVDSQTTSDAQDTTNTDTSQGFEGKENLPLSQTD